MANRAGVSTATVSRALRGLPSVAEGTRLRIVRIARELDYTITPSASRLASGRTQTIAVVAPYVNRWFFGQLIVGIEEVLRAKGFDLLLYNLADAVSRDRFFEAMPLRRRVDGVAVLSMPLSEEQAATLSGLGVPLGLVGAEVDGFACVRIDDVAGATSAMRHLVMLGHRDIAHICGGGPVAHSFTTPRDRSRAYREVLHEAGIGYRPELEAVGDYTVAGGERAMSTLLSGATRPTAVFAQSDEMAFGALQAIRRSGLRVPDDISLVGFDNHELADVLELTTVEQPVAEQGNLIAQILVDLLESGGEPPPTMTLPTRLVVRGSTRPVQATPHQTVNGGRTGSD
ncbi:LacI family DNA-binding transcriptional regulator [Nocardiopsis valliformis]|uniref:LacI family DNA-binding transcriptional regulator n=1 Tax=Nocardiopsis valliformis TaxID=239974 RepID=UPI00036FBCCB|nr:LacI family DNA-binding transcriptional regulator [Nocardiopsis valliformis]